jgi:hypothetical protein
MQVAKAIFTIDTDIYLGLQPCKIPPTHIME